MAFFAILFLFPHTEHLVNSSMELGDFKVEFFFVGHHLSMMISITTTYDLCLFYIIFHRSDRSDAWNWLSLWR